MACKSPYAQQEQGKATTMTKEQQQDVGYQYFHPDARIGRLVDSFYNAMRPEERAAQMIMTASSTADNMGYPHSKAKSLLQQNKVAGIVFLKGDALTFAAQIAELKQASGLQPLFACDCEPSLLNSKWANTGITVQAAAQQKDLQSVRDNTKKINKVMQQTGVSYNFAPIADRSANASVINKRSFGNDPAIITQLAQQFITSSQESGIAATIKHFPGHGMVQGDSHKQSVYIDGALQELPVFKALVGSKQPPVSVMVGHIVVRNNDKYNTEGLPATLSRKIVTDLLRKELKYDGIITTDAMNMAAAKVVADADWAAVEAGIDLVLMPSNPAGLHEQITTALQQNTALSQQLEASIKRIIRLKVIQQIILPNSL